jgi:hypothetical protein
MNPAFAADACCAAAFAAVFGIGILAVLGFAGAAVTRLALRLLAISARSSLACDSTVRGGEAATEA